MHSTNGDVGASGVASALRLLGLGHKDRELEAEMSVRSSVRELRLLLLLS